MPDYTSDNHGRDELGGPEDEADGAGDDHFGGDCGGGGGGCFLFFCGRMALGMRARRGGELFQLLGLRKTAAAVLKTPALSRLYIYLSTITLLKIDHASLSCIQAFPDFHH